MTGLPPGELIASLATSLPPTVPQDRLDVEWQRSLGDRMGGRPGRPVALTLRGLDLVLTLRSDDGRRAVAQAAREVRGVVISRREVSLAEWLELLAGQLRALAAASSADQAAVGRALTAAGLREPGFDVVVDGADVATGLRELPARLAGRVPSDVVATVERICAALLDTLPRLQGEMSQQSHTVLRTATDYLPGTLRAYLALPADWARGHDLGGGRTPLDELRTQLATLESAVAQQREAALALDARALAANGLFLEDRFGSSTLG